MKTLKKTLCVVLAVVMAVGTLAITASATDFADDANITYDEAVEVLTGLGIINGKENNRFDPEGTLTRAEGAKIITYALLTPTTADILKASSDPFNDVAASNWAAGSVEYCVSQGIIAGVGNNKFDPQGTLTGVAFAKMFLVALGIEGNFENTTAWDTNVVLAARKAELDNGMTGFNYYDAITREEACQMALNALFYGETVTTTATRYMILATADAKNSPSTVIGKDYASYGEAISAATGANASALVGADYTVSPVTVTTETKRDSLALDVYNLVSESVNVQDDFGRPAVTYVQNKGKVNEKDLVTVARTPVATYTTTVTADELYNKLGSTATISASASVHTKTATDAGYIKADGTIEATTPITVSAKSVAIGGNGIVTEIYSTSVKDNYIVVQIQPTLYKLSAPTNVAATTTEGAHTDFTVGAVTLKQYTTVVNVDKDKTNYTTDRALAQGDYVFVYGNNTAGYTVRHATLVTGKMTGFSSANGYAIAGNNYKASSADAGSALTDAITSAGYNTDATFVVDTYGYVLGTITVTVPTNYIYVLEAGAFANYLNSSTNRVESVYEVAAITTSGELRTIQVSKVGDGATATDSSVKAPASDNNTKCGIYSFTIDANGRYVLYNYTADNVNTINKSAQLASGKYADNATKYYVANETNNVWSVVAYTGYANINLGTTNPNATYLDANGDNVAEVVFVNGGTIVGATANYVYVTGSFTSDGTNVTYDVIVDGAASTMKLTPDRGLSAPLTAGLYNVSNGTAKLATATPAYVGKYLTYSNGLLMTATTNGGVNTYADVINATVPVYTFQNGVCTTSTAAALSYTTGSVIVVATNTTGAITAIYIVA